jgi:hypothetical protein
MDKLALGIALVALLIAGFGFFTPKGETVFGGTTNYDALSLDKAPLCFNFYATSTATRLKLTASTTATLPAGAAAIMTADYGSCTN